MARNGEWTLAYGTTSLDFGLADSPAATFSKAPDLGDVALLVADFDRPLMDGVAFGVDYRGGRTITFEFSIARDTEADALAALGVLARAWRADEIRSRPGAMAILTARQGGHERVVYGRPRRFAPNLDNAPDGLVTVVADFACVDDLFYEGYSKANVVALVPPPSGGLLAPLASPLATTLSSDRSIVLDVGGEVPTWPVFTIYGPITNPVIDVVGRYRIPVDVTLAAGSSLVIDTRAWARTVKRDGASVAGLLSPKAPRLQNTALAPGRYEVALRGTSAPGTASARIAWRDAFPTL